MPRITARRLFIAAAVAVTVIAVVTAFHDVPAVAAALRNFDWRLLPLGLAMAITMHGLRFWRWHLYAGHVSDGALRLTDSLHIYLAGLGTHLTPGRVAGTPVARSAPIMLAERVMDGVGLFALALPGAVTLGLGGTAGLVLLAAGLLLMPALASHHLHRAALFAAARTPLIRRYVPSLERASDDLRVFMLPRIGLPAALMSVTSVALEVGVFALALHGAGLPVTWDVYLRAGFVLTAGMLASAVFMVPGNLGVAEGGIAALTRSLLAATAPMAAAAALIMRFLTLWTGLLAGFAALATATRTWGRATGPEPESVAALPGTHN